LVAVQSRWWIAMPSPGVWFLCLLTNLGALCDVVVNVV
jgi:hypothetical protein